MELKFGNLVWNIPKSIRSNRTFMELKSFTSGRFFLPLAGSNRTFMELKSVNEDFIQEFKSVLIVPLWN